jgi:hypothetical protein
MSESYSSTNNSLVDFFSKAGAIRTKRPSARNVSHDAHSDYSGVLDLFEPAWLTDNHKAMQLAFWLRDCRGGSGNRGCFREILRYLAIGRPEWVIANIHLVCETGRWDDYKVLLGTSCEDAFLTFWVESIKLGDGLAAKWAPRKRSNKELFEKMRKIANLSPKDYRKLLVANTTVVESLMCDNKWNEIDYNKVPSMAMSRYAKAFAAHDGERFQAYKDALSRGDEGVKVNASVLFPHDALRTAKVEIGHVWHGWGIRGDIDKARIDDSALANAQFDALPNYISESGQRIMPICDFSRSMDMFTVDNMTTALDVSLAMGLYCSDRVGEDSPFYRKFIRFSDKPELVDWKGYNFSVAAQRFNDGFVGSTYILGVFEAILATAQANNVTDDQMPTTLFIFSDMQFNSAILDGETSVEKGIRLWQEAGYSAPKIVYWNLEPHTGSPATVGHQNVGLVSGFSPSLLKAILEGTDFTPVGIMERAIAKYEVVNPSAGSVGGETGSLQSQGQDLEIV